jgi:hypothetical protein
MAELLSEVDQKLLDSIIKRARESEDANAFATQMLERFRKAQ